MMNRKGRLSGINVFFFFSGPQSLERAILLANPDEMLFRKCLIE